MSKYEQWAQQAKEAGALDATTGGAYETPTGRPPGMRAVYDSPSSAGLLTSMRAGLSDDPNTRANVYAGARFPDDPNASERYGIIGGDVVYSGDDGNLYREGAGVAGMGEAIGAGGPAFVGGTVGGLIGGPVGAGLGAAGAEGYRLAASNLMNDEPQTVGGNMIDMGAEAALNAGGWKLGDVIGNRLISRRTARDISRYNLGDARKLTNKAQNVGIELTGPEATGLRSLLGKQRVLQATHGEAGDILGDFYQRRTTQQIPRAIDDAIGPQRDAFNVGARIQRTAAQELADMRAYRDKVGSPAYKAAGRDSGVATENVVDLIDGKLEKYANTSIGRELARVRSSLKEPAKASADDAAGAAGKDALKRRVDQLHAVKMDIDRKIGALNRQEGSTAGTTVNELMDVQASLLDEIEKVSAAYRQARAQWAVMSMPIAEAKAGLIGELSKDVNRKSLQGMAERLLGPNSSPTTIMQARALFNRKAPGLWDDTLSVYLRQTWEKAAKPIQAGANPKAGANFAVAMRAKPMERNMRAAMGADRYQSFSNLLDVLEATGRVQGGDSITAFAQQGAVDMARDAAPVAGAALKPFSLRDWYLDSATEKFKAELARVMTDPQAINKLRELKSIDPRSQSALNIVSDAVTSALGGGVASQLESRPAPRLPAR